MKKTKNKSEVSLSLKKSETQCREDIYNPPLDVLVIKVLNLRVPDEECKPYYLKMTFFNQLLLSNVITSSKYKANNNEKVIAKGYMKYDPSDYEKMSLFADSPLIVTIQPFTTAENSSTSQSQISKSGGIENKIDSDIYSCNIDILPIFTDKNKITLKQRMEMTIPTTALHSKSWDNLPEIKLCIKTINNVDNAKHKKKFKHANLMTITFVGCYNTIAPIDDMFEYTAATKLPLQNELHSGIFTFIRGHKQPKRFNNFCFYPQWESVRANDDVFPKGNKKLEINPEELQNKDDIDFKSYANNNNFYNTVIWRSFHRTIILRDTEQWLSTHLRRYQWPIELSIYGENHGYNFMSFLDLLKLLYPGETKVQIVVPLQWFDRNMMLNNCGCENLLTSTDKTSSTTVKASKATTDSVNVTIETVDTVRPTGGDGKCAFVIVEVSLAKPLLPAIIPAHINESDLTKMLHEMEAKSFKRKCTGRGQLNHDWEATVHNAISSLRRVPYYGLPDPCSVSRQLSATRIRVEVFNSFWQEGAIYVNNKFVLHDFLQSNHTFEEMTMIAHARLMRVTSDTLMATDVERENSTLKAARHARQCQDLPHAVQLYLQLIVEGAREANSWRELATCLKDVDQHWANACINKCLNINPRHPLSLLSKSCMMLENDPDAAEPFFKALLLIYPFSVTFCVCVSAYYLQIEQFHMAQQIIELAKKTKEENLSDDWRYPRAWERELGDWWDNTPLLPGTNLYYDAADLLLRIRGISLAEVCVARALTETGESPVYYHLVAMCCRLKGQIDNALCHLQQGIEKFGEISYLRSLQGECYHKQKNLSAASAAFSKVGNCGGYIALLSFPCKEQEQRTQSVISDITRRYPSAYAWMTYADYWLMNLTVEDRNTQDIGGDQKTTRANAKSCLFRALRCDRHIGRAWALLASLLKPDERRQYCRTMATMCDYNRSLEERSRLSLRKKESPYFLGKTIRECYCKMCENLFL